MDKKSDDILNKKEKKEIITDVTDAINKAKGIRHTSLNKEMHTKKVLFITAFIVLLISSSFIYWFLANNPKTIFTRSVDVVFDNLTKNINEPIADNTKGSINLKINSASGEYSDLNRYDVKTTYNFDSINNISKNNIKINYDSNHLIDLDLYSIDKKLYLYSLDFFDKYIELDKNMNYDAKSINMMLKSINIAINEAIDKQKVSGSRLSLTINDKNMYAYKSSLELNKENLNIILDKINNSLLKDERFLNSCTKIFGADSAGALNSIINRIKNKNIENLVINIYTDGVEHEFIKLELLIDNDIVSITNTGKNKYNYLLDLVSKNVKYEGIVKLKGKNDKFIINNDFKMIKNDNISSLNYDIAISQKSSTNNLKDENLNGVRISELSNEEREIISNKIHSNPFLERYINILK